ncbi:MAG: hypothetical protein NT105_20680 [Verrucomicrobia bacterium]|nr:hypothetical protein [Verrucomicrobiota bacterium]
MKKTILVAMALILAVSALAQTPKRDAVHGILGDYDAEPRLADKHVDADFLLARLKELGANTYLWLIWHQPTDWEDLQCFLPKAAEAGIDVWVYLVPPSEPPPSEPFGLDYLRWGEEIAKLSLKHANLKAWMIDDFHANTAKLFTPGYVRAMQARAKAVNPRIVFLPLMYYGEITRKFVDDYREVVDGVVAAYPEDRDEITAAWELLNDVRTANAGELSYPWSMPSRAGDFIQAAQPAAVQPAARTQVRFREKDDFRGATAGYHFKQLLVDDAVVWEQDAAVGGPSWQDVTVDLTDAVRGKENVTLAFRLFDKKGVSNFGVRWQLRDLRAEGLRVAADFREPQKWTVRSRGAFQSGFDANAQEGKRRFHVPFIVMTAGQRSEFKMRHGEPASPDRIAEWVRLSLRAWHDGQCNGVVMYCLEKSRRSAVFDAVRKEFRAAPDQSPTESKR